MSGWLSNWKRKGDRNIEAELRRSRPKASDQFVKALAARVNPRPQPLVRPRARVGVALALSASLIAVLGATGGLGNAASGVSGAASGVGGTFGLSAPVNSGGSVSAADQYALTPTITSVSASGGLSYGKAGSTVTVTGTNFAGHSEITSATVNGDSASFVITGSTTLTLTIPSSEGAGTATIVVHNDAGDSNPNTDFTILGAPAFDSTTPFTPNEAGAGQTVDISGSNFTGVSKVTFGGKPATIDTSSSTDSDLFVTVPVAAATTGPVEVDVTNPIQTTKLLKTDPNAFTFDSGAPTVGLFSPLSGVAGSATSVTIHGTNLNHSLDIYFGTDVGSATGKITVDNSAGSASVVTVPSIPTGAQTGEITIDNGIGQASSTKDFTILSAPSITSFSPSSGHAGTQVVTVLGTSFIAGSTTVQFHGAASTVAATVTGTTKLTAKVPSDATPGTFTVDTGNGSPATSPGIFNTNAPTFDATTPFTPNEAGAGQTVDISGSDFTGVTKVTFGGKPATIDTSSSTDSDLFVTVPAAAATTGPVEVDLTNGAGTTKLLKTAATAFTYDSGAPTVGLFTPDHGAIGDTNTPITIHGTNLNHSLDIYFGTDVGSATGKVTIDNSTGSATQVTVPSVPSGAVTGDISIDNGIGQATSTKAFTIIETPSIVSFSPASGKVGTKVTLYGSGFTGVDEVDFNGVPATAAAQVKSVSGGLPGITQSISTTVPAGASTGVITIYNAAQSADTGSDVFTVEVKPTFADSPFSPTSGIVGDTVTITGSGFTGTKAVKFGAKPATSWTVVSDTELTAVVPSGATTGKVTVQNDAATSLSAATFGVITAPTLVSTITPASSAVGGTVTITGLHLSGAELSPGGSVDLEPGDIAMDNVTLVSDGKLTADVPSGATSGSTYTIKVTNSAGSKESTKTLLVVNPPTITSLGATSGPVGSTLTVNGTNLKGATAVTFGIGNSHGDTVSVKPLRTATDGSSLTVKVPPMALSGKISVTNVGIESSASTVTFTVAYGTPTVNSLLPLKAAVGATVKISGSHFTGVQDTGGSVTFNGTSATSFTVVSDTVINAVVPAGATTGSVVVSTVNGASAGKPFTVLPTPTITGFHSGSATTVLVKKTVKITVDGTNLVAPAKVTFTNGSTTITVPAIVARDGNSFSVTTSPKMYIGSWTVTIDTAGVTATGSVDVAVHA